MLLSQHSKLKEIVASRPVQNKIVCYLFLYADGHLVVCEGDDKFPKK